MGRLFSILSSFSPCTYLTVVLVFILEGFAEEEPTTEMEDKKGGRPAEAAFALCVPPALYRSSCRILRSANSTEPEGMRPCFSF
ncbi:hypothetical protein BDZ97DRAFT_1776699 [Flammula alnicola]|nr:hypothetical protein BDZ97DRAFT_1776699 [Flammula alnicola]